MPSPPAEPTHLHFLNVAVRPALFGLLRALNVALPDPLPLRQAKARLAS